MYLKILDELADKMRSDGDAMQPPATEQQLLQVRKKAQEKLGHDLPEGYRRFLAEVNGLNYDGLVIYATEPSPIIGYEHELIEGFVEANVDDREFEPMSRYLAFGQNEFDVFVLDLKTGEYQVINQLRLNVCRVAGSFDQLLEWAIAERFEQAE